VLAVVVGGILGLIAMNIVLDAWRTHDDTTVAAAPTRTPAAGDVHVQATGVSLMLPAGWRTAAVTPSQIAKLLAEVKKNNPGLTSGASQLQASAAKGYVVLYAAHPSRVQGGWNTVNVQVVPRQGAHPSDVLPGYASAITQIGATKVSAVETAASGRQAIRVTFLLSVKDASGRHVQEEVQYVVFGPDKVAIITVSETRDAAGHATRAAADAEEMASFVTFG
jgi:hypothetical protein